jgi:hypothetical protein
VISYFLFFFQVIEACFSCFQQYFDSRDSFLNLRVFNVRMYHWHSLIAIIPLSCYIVKHFNRFESVEQLSMTTNDGSWVLSSNIVFDLWSNNVGDILRLGFHRNTKTMFLSYVLGTIFECDKFQGLHFNYFSYVLVSLNSHFFWIVWKLNLRFFYGPILYFTTFHNIVKLF